ncbi:protease [Thalassobaculum fulvum]|uniref:Protease n=1 Tax=Thalassobaculum fulvum TaxID=1633335 RepID=A0A919CNI0_9PROT|nr:S8 family serine peptidase [Thalassobaculum fulvum]GHD44005.1 protease [Thalassobaculum fulvum]
MSNEFVGLFASPDTVELAQQLGLEVEERSLSSLGLVISRFRAATPDQAAAAQVRLREAERAGNAVFAPNSVYRPMSGTCGDGGCTVAGLRRAARLSSACRQPMPIGIVDTEVERSHPALRSRAITVARFLPAAGATPAADGHGTAIAALLVGDPASRFPGMAPDTRLYAANAFSLGPEDDVRADAFNLAEALDWLVQARPGVINLSLAGPPNLLLQTALARTVDRGIVVVAAAGNGGPAAPPAYPAAYDRVIAVTAVDERQRPYVWANQGDYVQFAAPGVELWTAGTGGSGERRTGTSLAAALFAGFVAGAAPLRATRSEEVAAWARGHAVDLGPQGRDPVYGWGVIHLETPCGR